MPQSNLIQILNKFALRLVQSNLFRRDYCNNTVFILNETSILEYVFEQYSFERKCLLIAGFVQLPISIFASVALLK